MYSTGRLEVRRAQCCYIYFEELMLGTRAARARFSVWTNAITVRRAMEFEGKVWKDGRAWLVEVPALNLMTQGTTKKDALEMAQEAVFGLVECYFESEVMGDFAVTASDRKNGMIGISANDMKLLPALSLRRQREQSGSIIREASARLGSQSPNAYAQYERGKTNISIDKHEALLRSPELTGRC
ncbi:MAG: type II toxin-antitoxin system HicB family antitoxin [Chlamydiia bacterium]